MEQIYTGNLWQATLCSMPPVHIPGLWYAVYHMLNTLGYVATAQRMGIFTSRHLRYTSAHWHEAIPGLISEMPSTKPLHGLDHRYTRVTATPGCLHIWQHVCVGFTHVQCGEKDPVTPYAGASWPDGVGCLQPDG